MDKIYIKNLQVYGYHGVFSAEKDIGQRFLISAEIFLDLREAGKSDDLTKTVHYGDLCAEIEKEFNKVKYDLIETAGEALAEYILLNKPLVKRAKVLIKKPWAPIGKPLDYVAIQVDRAWHTAYIGMGSNMGDKEKNLKAALEIINNSTHTNVEKVSKYYITKPVGYLEQEDFLNSAAQLKTLLSPIELVRFLLTVEKELKRERIIRWGPRTVDLDVLLYDDCVTCTEEIVIPHPRMEERLFVLQPLNDIAPYVVHPILRKRIGVLMKEILEK